MSVVLTLDLDASAAERVVADLLIAPFFASDRPLRGPASRVDWRLCGLLSRQLEGGGLEGRAGEAALVPSGGRIRAPRVMLLGLGPRPGFDVARLREAAREATRRAAQLRTATVALALPAEALSGVAVDRGVAAATEGAAAAIAERPFPLRLRLVVAEPELARAMTALEAAARQSRGREVVLRIVQPEVVPAPARRPASELPEGSRPSLPQPRGKLPTVS